MQNTFDYSENEKGKLPSKFFLNVFSRTVVLNQGTSFPKGMSINFQGGDLLCKPLISKLLISFYFYHSFLCLFFFWEKLREQHPYKDSQYLTIKSNFR